MSAEKSMARDLTVGSVPRKLIGYSIPFALASVLQTMYTLVDMVIVGHVVGSTGISALGISGQILHMFTAVGIGFSTGGQILVSQLVGAGDKKGTERSIGTLFTALASLSLVLLAAGILLSTPLLKMLNTPEEAMEQAKAFLVISCLGIPFIYGYNAISAVLRGMGQSKLPLVFVAISTVVNIALELLFVAVLRMQAAGAAFATVIAQAVSFITALAYLYVHRETFGFDFRLKSFSVDKSKLKILTMLGLPLTLESVAISISMMFVSSFINAYGLVAASVDSVGNKLQGVMFIISGSLTSAGGAMIGQNIGARKLDRVKEIYRVSLAICMVFCLIVSAVCLLFPTQIFGLFDKDPDVLAMAPVYLKIAILGYLSFATMTPPLAVLYGVGYASFNLVIALLDGVVVRILLSLLLGQVLGLGLVGFWLGNCLAGFTSTILGNLYYWSGKWKTRKLLVE